MRAAGWLALSLTLALVEGQDESIAPGVRVLQSRPKRQGIIFPEAQSNPDRFSLHPGNPAIGPNPMDAPDAALELPEELDLNTMDQESLSRLNSIDQITAFADLFGISLPADDASGGDLRFVPRFGVDEGVEEGARRSSNDEAVEMATMATCKPEIRTVELDLPTEANTLFYPTCVRLEQCGGCCYGPRLTCRPKVTKVVRLKVLKTVVSTRSRTSVARSRDDSRRQRRRRRRRRQSIPSFHVVEALKHVQCTCGCKVQEQDCNPAIHSYLKSECACVCKRRDEKQKCEQQNDTKYWDNNSCACYCRKSVDCSTGEFFSQDSCECERLVARGGFSVDTIEGPVERRRPLRPFERPPRRRPVRVPLHHDSNQPTLFNIFEAPRTDIIF